MKTVVLQYDKNGFHFRDDDGQEVIGIYRDGSVVLQSYLHGDQNWVVSNFLPMAIGEQSALELLGFPMCSA